MFHFSSSWSISFILLCFFFLVILPTVFSFHSFNNFFPNSNFFTHQYYPRFHQPQRLPQLTNIFNQPFFTYPILLQRQTSPLQEQESIPTPLECLSICRSREEQSLNEAKYRTQTDATGVLNLFIDFKDNGQPISIKNVELRVREDISRRQHHPLSSFSRLGLFSPFIHTFPPLPPSYLLDLSISRPSPPIDSRTSMCCNVASKEEYVNSFALPEGTDISRIVGELVRGQDKNWILKVKLPKEGQNVEMKEKNIKENEKKDNSIPNQLTEKKVESTNLQINNHSPQESTHNSPDSQSHHHQQLLQDHEHLQKEQEYLQKHSQILQEKQQKQKQKQNLKKQNIYNEQKQQLYENKEKKNLLEKQNIEEDKILKERKEKIFKERNGAQGEVIKDLLSNEEKKIKKIFTME